MKKYLTPEILVTSISAADVITASFNILSIDGGDTTSWSEFRTKSGVSDGAGWLS